MAQPGEFRILPRLIRKRYAITNHLLADVDAADVDLGECPAVAICAGRLVGDRAAVQQRAEVFLGGKAEDQFILTTRLEGLRRVEFHDPDSDAIHADGVAIDDVDVAPRPWQKTQREGLSRRRAPR